MISILLVDDDLDEYDLFTTALQQLTTDYTLHHVTECNDLFCIIKDVNPHLVFLDINMPGMSGIECLKSIRADKKFHLLPIIMYSTSSSRINIQEAYENNANFYIVKPYSIHGIIKALEKVISIDWQIETRPSMNNFVIP